MRIEATIDPKNQDQINLNLQTTMDEIEQTLRKCNSKSRGTDKIPYCFVHN